MAREYFLTYHDNLSALKLLSDSERGRLYLALLEYSAKDENPAYENLILNGNEKFLFEIMKTQIDREKEKYKKQCGVNKENGKYGSLGGRPNKTAKPSGKNPPRVLKTPKEEEDEEEDENKDEEKYLPPLSPNGDISPKGNGEVEIAASAAPRGVSAEIKEKFFDDFWAKYPKKVAKEAVRKAYLRLKSTTPNKVMAGLLKWEKTEQWTKDGKQRQRQRVS